MMQEMTREAFYDFAASEIKNYIPGAFEKIEIIDVSNSRGQYKGLTAKKQQTAGATIAPVVNLDKFYDEYNEDTTFDGMFERMASIITMPPPTNTHEVSSYITDWEKVKDRLFVSLVNIKNAKTMVHRKAAGDVVMIARVLVSDDTEGIASAIVSEDLLNRWHQTQDDIFEFALENTRNLMGLAVRNMSDIFGTPAGAPAMKIVSNRSGNFGAAALFYPGTLEKVSEDLGGDFYALPSSIHEFLCIPKFGPTADEFRDLVRNVNETVVEASDVLSNCVFFYDSKRKKFVEV